MTIQPHHHAILTPATRTVIQVFGPNLRRARAGETSQPVYIVAGAFGEFPAVEVQTTGPVSYLYRAELGCAHAITYEPVLALVDRTLARSYDDQVRRPLDQYLGDLGLDASLVPMVLPESTLDQYLTPRATPQRRPPLPIPADYDPDTSPDSPRAGGCCDPPPQSSPEDHA